MVFPFLSHKAKPLLHSGVYYIYPSICPHTTELHARCLLQHVREEAAILPRRCSSVTLSLSDWARPWEIIFHFQSIWVWGENQPDVQSCLLKESHCLGSGSSSDSQSPVEWQLLRGFLNFTQTDGWLSGWTGFLKEGGMAGRTGAHKVF